MQNGTYHRLEAALSRLSHAYIICAPAGEEALSLAQTLAAAYICADQDKRPCGVCAGCRKAQGNIHPDIIYLSAADGKRNITVDQVRQLRAQAYIRPNEAPRKVFVIKNAETMNDNAQNALLKVLEDGPAYLAFLLLSEQPQLLLPTIRSRCEILNLMDQTQDRGVELDEELRSAVQELTLRLTSGNERALAEYTAQLEQKKWEKDTFLAFLDAVEDALQENLLQNSKQYLPLIEHLKKIRRAALFNVGMGHLLGWLTVEYCR